MESAAPLFWFWKNSVLLYLYASILIDFAILLRSDVYA